MSYSGSTLTTPLAITTKTSDYTITLTDGVINCETYANPGFTVTLPTAVGISGREFTVKDSGGNCASEAITIACTGGQTIDGASTKTINSAYGTYTFISNGTNWNLKQKITAGGTGDVVGPSSSTDSNVVMFDGTTGKLIKDSGVTLSGSNTGDQDLTPYFNKTDDDTADIVENPDYRFLSVTNQGKLDNLSGTNTGDQDLSPYQLIADMATDVPANETDPVFTASDAFNIDATDITNINNLSGVNTGDQDLSTYQLISGMSTDVPANETDPVFSAHAAASITSTDITNLGNLSGTNTGDQTITLTGGVTGSGTGSFEVTVVTNANLTGPITSFGNATTVASQTGTGDTFVMDTSPTLVTPTLGAATATTINGVTITSVGTSATLTIGEEKILTASNTLTLAGTDGKTITVSDDATISGTNTGDQTVTIEAAQANSSITPVADGTYTVGQGLITNGTITVSKGIITAVQEAS